MQTKIYASLICCLTLSMLSFTSKAQTTTKLVLFDGILVADYVDKGANINCIGPALKFNKKPYSILLGMLPSLRLKEDKVLPGATKNTLVTSNLGFGLIAIFKHLAFQLPLYYIIIQKQAAKTVSGI